MNKLYLSSAVFLCALFLSGSTVAASKQEQALQETLQANLSKARPGLLIQEVVKSNVPNLFEVTLNNGDVLYATEDGKHIIAGKILRLDENRLVDVMEERLKPLRAETLSKTSVNDSINFVPADDKAKAVVYVFTDVDCGFCQKLHSHMSEFNALGIEIRYLAFPRAGAFSVSAKKLVNAWCAKDKNDAMNKLLSRQNIPEADCENPVAAEYTLGQKLGVTGTPAVIKADGDMIGGYLTPDQMAQALGL